ncbi:MAG: hypothetical protein MPJ05_07725 [Nitrosopumilus sp.]|nr:hypothetical protein [Nitrosopumilus sp.]MDA7942407.1 hypothetical protein [Nitrosopumilus sp.]MDA7944872.1 hypothetical protein [Nitrosopumilus sp.]MDA7953682.1 hypothetical protein [Nitrosopumilus sp.]MDA7954519.1 hypothetical protein [Nitrosopumilus sp.]
MLSKYAGIAVAAALGAQHAAALPVDAILVEPGIPAVVRGGPLEVALTYERDGALYVDIRGGPDQTWGTRVHPGESFTYGCLEGEGARTLLIYQYRGAAREGDGVVLELARASAPAPESVDCTFPTIREIALPGGTWFLDPPDWLYGAEQMARLYDPAHPYMTGLEAYEAHMERTYADPVRDAVVFSGPDIHAYPARPYEGTYVGPERELGGHPGWIADVWFDPADGSLVVEYHRTGAVYGTTTRSYDPGQTFVYGCFDHVEPTLLYIYRYEGVRGGGSEAVLSSLEAYADGVPCTDDILYAAVDAHDPAAFDVEHSRGPDHPPLPSMEETRGYYKYAVPLGDPDYTWEPVPRAVPLRMIGAASYGDGIITGILPGPGGSLYVSYGNHSRAYEPGQTFVFDCKRHESDTRAVMHKYLGIGDAAGEPHLAYLEITADPGAPVPCSVPEMTGHVADIHGEDWFRAAGWTYHVAGDVLASVARADPSAYAPVAGAGIAAGPRVFEPLPDRMGYRPWPHYYGPAHAEVNGGGSVTITYTDGYGRLGAVHEQTYGINQTFAYRCDTYDGTTHMWMYHYLGPGEFQGAQTLSLVQFKIEAPGTVPCTYPDYLEHTVDLYDPGRIGAPRGAGPYSAPDDPAGIRAAYLDPVRHAVVTSPLYRDPLSYYVPDAGGTSGWISNMTANGDGTLSVTFWNMGEDRPGQTHGMVLGTGEPFVAQCAEDGGTTSLTFYSYAGPGAPYGTGVTEVLEVFEAYTKAPVPCAFPDVFVHGRGAFDMSWFG